MRANERTAWEPWLVQLVPRPEAFRRMVDDTLQLIKDTSPSSEAAAPHVVRIVLSVFRAMSAWIDVAEIDEKLEPLTALDLTGLQTGAQILATASPSRGRESSYQNKIANLNEAIEELGRTRAQDPALLPAGLTTVDRLLEEVLRTLPPDWDPDQLTRLVVERLRGSSLRRLQRLWRLIVRECWTGALPAGAAEDDYPLVVSADSVLEASFFDIDALVPAELRKQIAHYHTWGRARLVAEAVERGRAKLPVNPEFNLAQALCHRTLTGAGMPSELDWVVSRSVGLLAQPRTLPGSERIWNVARDTLHLREDGPTLGMFATSKPNSNARQELEMLYALAMLLTACAELMAAPPGVLDCLRRYKLCAEIADGDLSSLLEGRDDDKAELELQRDICRFLLSHGIHAVGTRFARSQTDLVVAEGGDLHIVEAKVYRHPPTIAELNAHFPQLDSYWEDFLVEPTTRTLIVFNKSDALLTAPNKMLGGDTLLIFVNLLTAAPSGRKRSFRFSDIDGELTRQPGRVRS